MCLRILGVSSTKIAGRVRGLLHPVAWEAAANVEFAGYNRLWDKLRTIKCKSEVVLVMYKDIFKMLKWRRCARENALTLSFPRGGQRPKGHRNGSRPFMRLIKEYEEAVGYVIEELHQPQAIDIECLKTLACLIKQRDRQPKWPNIVFTL